MTSTKNWKGAVYSARYPLTIVALVALFLFPFVFLGEAFFLRDAQIWFYPAKLYLRTRLLSGDLPLWIPELGLGMPFLADPGNTVLYPLNLVLLLPAPLGVTYFLVAHVMIAALGTYALLRWLHLGRPASLFGALAYGLCGYILSMTSSGTYLLSVAWMPLVLAAGVRTIDRRDFRSLAILALAVGCQILTGEVQGALLTVAMIGVMPLAASPRHWGAYPWLLGAGAAGIAIASPQVISTLSFLPETTRFSGISLEEGTRWDLHPFRLVEMVASGLFGDPSDPFSYLGAFLVDESREYAFPWMESIYAGSITVVLALTGVLTLVRRVRRGSPRFLVIGAFALVSLLLSFGRHTPLFELYFTWIPGAGLFRYPSKFFPVTALGIACIAAFGLDFLTFDMQRRIQAGRIVFAIWSAIACALLVGQFFSPEIAEHLWLHRTNLELTEVIERVRNSLLLEGSLLVVLGLLLFLLYRKRPSLAPLAVVAALFAQLLVMNHPIAKSIDGSLYTDQTPLMKRILDERRASNALPRVHLRSTVSKSIMGCLTQGTPQEIAVWKQAVLQMNTGIVHGIGYPFVYSALMGEDLDSLLATAKMHPKELLNLLGVAYIITPADQALPEDAGVTYLRELSTPCFRVYRNRDAMPVIRPVPLVAPDTENAVLSPAVLGGEAAIIEGVSATPKEGHATGASGHCTVNRFEGDAHGFQCSLSDDRFVVIAVSYTPHWEATLDGKRIPIHRANRKLTAVRVPAGTHEITLTYRQPGLTATLVFAGVVLLLTMGLAVFGPKLDALNR